MLTQETKLQEVRNPPPYSVSEKKFPFPALFERQLKAEWAKPINNFLPSLRNYTCYPPLLMRCCRSHWWMLQSWHCSLQTFFLRMVRDLSVTIWTRGSTLPSLRWTHEAMDMASKASSTASVFSRAAIVWECKMLQLLLEMDKRLLGGTNRLLKAASFISDATLAALIFCPRALASATVARRNIWVCAWQADLTAILYQFILFKERSSLGTP